MSGTPAASRSRIGRLVLTILVFLALGPLVGGLIMIVGIGISIGVATHDASGVAASIATMVIYGLWASYPMGALPALIAGGVIGYCDMVRRGSAVLALVVGSAIGLVMVVAGGALQNPSVGAIFYAACVIATLVCYAATRPIARRN